MYSCLFNSGGGERMQIKSRVDNKWKDQKYVLRTIEYLKQIL